MLWTLVPYTDPRGPFWLFCRSKGISPVDTYQYTNRKDDFSRAPFIVKFSAFDSGEQAQEGITGVESQRSQ